MGDINGAVADAEAAHGMFAFLVAHDTSDAVLRWQLAKSDRQFAQALLERGDSVHVLVRDPARAEPLRARGAELVQGDMTDAASLRRAVEGVEVVYQHGRRGGRLARP